MKIAKLAICLVSLVVAGCMRTNETERTVTTERLISEGVSYDDPVERAVLEAALKASGVPYAIQSRGGSTYVSWEAKHSQTVHLMQAELFGPPLPPGRNLSSSPVLHERFKAWLFKNNIPYRLQHSRGQEYVIWEEEFTPKVRTWQFFPAPPLQSAIRAD